jgi:KDO2-lipid IV(A) lauroyltransferase
MVAYLLLRFAVRLIGSLPFSWLYHLSDGLAWTLNRVVRYRRQVILENLRRSFPDLNPDEIQRILKKTYVNLSDIALESLKGLSLNQAALIERYRFTNPDLITQYFLNGLSVIGLVAHYNNWEWGALATGAQIKGPVIGVSKSIHNQRIHHFIKSRRARFGALIIDMTQTVKTLAKLRKQPSLIVLIADQSPSNARNAHWIKFLNQDTACLTGPDKIARRTNYPVVYFDVQRVQRGFYEVTAHILEEHPTNRPEAFITKSYFQQLENIIRRQPANWLWSHKRWKKRRINDPLSKE